VGQDHTVHRPLNVEGEHPGDMIQPFCIFHHVLRCYGDKILGIYSRTFVLRYAWQRLQMPIILDLSEMGRLLGIQLVRLRRIQGDILGRAFRRRFVRHDANAIQALFLVFVLPRVRV
jgi:hypothetical protein